MRVIMVLVDDRRFGSVMHVFLGDYASHLHQTDCRKYCIRQKQKRTSSNLRLSARTLQAALEMFIASVRKQVSFVHLASIRCTQTSCHAQTFKVPAQLFILTQLTPDCKSTACKTSIRQRPYISPQQQPSSIAAYAGCWIISERTKSCLHLYTCTQGPLEWSQWHSRRCLMLQGTAAYLLWLCSIFSCIHK